MNGRRAWALGIVATLLVAAGCGGGGGDRLSEAELREQGNAICAKYQEQIDALETPSAVEDIPGYVEEAAPIVEREIDELKELDPPEDVQETFDEMIAEAEKTVQAGRDLGEAAEANDAAAIEQTLDEGNAASARADEHATELGLTNCVDQEQ